MDPIRNPYAPGAGQRPPELTGRDAELAQFAVTLERVAQGRSDRGVILTGLRGVGKTVLLNTLRSQAIGRVWATGKVEAQAGQDIRGPLAAAVHGAVREIGIRHRDPDAVRHVLGVLKSFAHLAAPGRSPARGTTGARTTTQARGGWAIATEVPAVRGRADSGVLELDLIELLLDAASLAGDLNVGLALFLDEMQDLSADDLSALCGASHELGQREAPFLLIGAGLPHLPGLLSASKSYSERLFRYLSIDRLDRAAADLALTAPAEREGAQWSSEALQALYAQSGGYPYFVQAYGKAAWDAAPTSPITAEDVATAAPQAEAELAVGFFGSRWERATAAERDYLAAMATLGDGGRHVSTAAIAAHLGKKPASLSPARDSLLKKGLIYSAERGSIAFTVPHFDRFLLTREP